MSPIHPFEYACVAEYKPRLRGSGGLDWVQTDWTEGAVGGWGEGVDWEVGF